MPHSFDEEFATFGVILDYREIISKIHKNYEIKIQNNELMSSTP